jgi:hypothetical protein
MDKHGWPVAGDKPDRPPASPTLWPARGTTMPDKLICPVCGYYENALGAPSCLVCNLAVRVTALLQQPPESTLSLADRQERRRS